MEDISMVSSIFRALWGDISREEFKKFGLLSGVFFFIVGSYWMMRTMKNAVFMHLIAPEALPYAKMVSLISIITILVFYNKLVDLFEKTKLVYVIAGFYSVLYFGLAYFLAHPTIGIANHVPSSDRLLGWIIYVAIESFGSIVIPLFWAYVASIMDTGSARRGYPIIVSGAQLGSILGTFLVMMFADSIGLPILFIVSAIAVLCVPIMIRYFEAHFPIIPSQEAKKKSTGVIEGLRLILAKPYLRGILVVSTVYEIIGTIFEYQMNRLAHDSLQSVGKVAGFLGMQGFLINCLSFAFALLGTSLFIRTFGLTACLVIYPCAIAGLVLYAWSFPALATFLFCVVTLKGLGYALNNPCKEIMYIPTSKDIKFKAKSWIEAQGGRSAKGIGSGVNALFPVLSQLLTYGSMISLGIIAFWIPVALFVGKKNSLLVQENKIVE